MTRLVDFCDSGSGEEEIVSGLGLLYRTSPLEATTVDETDNLGLFAKLPGPNGSSWWPIGVCGDLGLGFGLINHAGFIEFDSMNSYTAQLGCDDPPVVEYEEVIAHACVLKCGYRIDDLTESSQVLMAKIDGSWHIIQVHRAALVGLFRESCNCCEVDGVYLEAEVTDASEGCEHYLTLPPWRLRQTAIGTRRWIGTSESIGCEESSEGPGIEVLVECNGITDVWSGIICGVAVEMTDMECVCGSDSASGSEEPTCGSVVYQWNDPPGEWVLFSNNCEEGCTAPAAPGPVGLVDGQQQPLDCEGTPVTTGGCSGSGSADQVTGVSGTVRISAPLEACCDCDWIDITIRSTNFSMELECWEDETIEEVVVEACGMSDLNPDESVIIINVPNPEPDSVQWHVLRACNNTKTCDILCDPPPPPPGPPCCGILCIDMPETLTATVEYYDTECGECTTTVTFHKQSCEAGTQYITLVEPVCTNLGTSNAGILELTCAVSTGEECAESGDPVGFDVMTLVSQILGNFTLNTDTQCCNPFFFEFELDSLSGCEPPDPASQPPWVKIRVTITA